MSFFQQIIKDILGSFTPHKDARNFSESPTRPLDAEALARALTGEGRSHITTGFASSTISKDSPSTSSLYLLMAQADGLNALPDFGIIGIAESERMDASSSNLSKAALSKLAFQLTQKAILDFLELEGFENSTPLQDIVIEAMKITDQAIRDQNPNVRYSLTAGLVIAEMLILGHRGDTRAYHIDRHHIERITAAEISARDSIPRSKSPVEQSSIAMHDDASINEPPEISVHSRPVPRDGYIMLCTQGLWKNIRERDMYKIVLDREDPKAACRALVSRVSQDNPEQELSVLLLYFPPDFVPWR